MTPEDLNYERYRVSHLRGMLAKLNGHRVYTLAWSLDHDEDENAQEDGLTAY